MAWGLEFRQGYHAKDGLRPNLQRFFDFISAKSEGEVVSANDILAAAGWAPATLDAHRAQKCTGPFLIHLGGVVTVFSVESCSLEQD